MFYSHAYCRERLLMVLLGAWTFPPATGQTDMLSTFGQLCKTSELAVVANIATVRIEGRMAELEIEPETILFGTATSPLRVSLGGSNQIPQVGERILAFISTKTISLPDHNPLPYAFRERDVAPEPESKRHVVGGLRGIIPLATNDNELVAIARSYASHLRSGATDVLGYGRMLNGLLRNTNERIRQDAKNDLIILIRYASPAELRQLMAQLSPDEQALRSHGEKILAWKEAGEPIRRRPPVAEDHEQLQRCYEALQSGANPDKLSALATLSKLDARALRASRDSWEDLVHEMLSSNEPTIRFSAASVLSAAGDLSCVPVLVDALSDSRYGIRALAYRELVKLCGTPVPFDPSAPEQERLRAIDQWRSWWAERRVGLPAEQKPEQEP